LVRRAFGIVFQDPSLDDQLTAAENMELHGVLYGVPRVERHERVEALLRFVGLWERRDDFVKRFSSCMKRRDESSHGPSLVPGEDREHVTDAHCIADVDDNVLQRQGELFGAT
jgi:ABC-type histidine transport system ATPase subunit